MTEEWRPVLGFETHYLISDQGRVWSLSRKKICQPHPGRGGYPRINLRRNNMRMIHVLVLEAFVGPRPEGMYALHNDGTRTNSALSNLRWDTPSANSYDQIKHGVHAYAKRDACKYGHPYVEGSFREFRGWRRCRRCTNENARKNYGLRDRVTCDQCGASLAHLKSLRRHVRLVHEAAPPIRALGGA